jgi:hypothetical protein
MEVEREEGRGRREDRERNVGKRMESPVAEVSGRRGSLSDRRRVGNDAGVRVPRLVKIGNVYRVITVDEVGSLGR